MRFQGAPVSSGIAMDAGTYAYDANSTFQRLVYKEAEKFFPELKGARRITIVDYGCGPGENWIHGVNALLSKADADVKFQLVLNDGVLNDWSAGARFVAKYQAEGLGGRDGHVVMLPGSFYQQIMPSGSVDVGMAWNSFHWLENHPPPADLRFDDKYFAAWQESIRPQGHADLVKLLRLRANEIKPGGHLILTIPTIATHATTKVYLAASLQALGKCVKDGLMTRPQYRAFGVPVFQPNEDDLCQILTAVQDLWSLPMPWAFPTLPHPAWMKFQESQKTPGDYERYAEDMAGFALGIYSGMIIRSLRYGNERKQQELSADEKRFLSEFKRRFKDALLSEPLKERRAESSWLILRLDRKSPGARAKL